MPVVADSASVRRVNGHEETEEAGGGCRQRHAGQAEAEEEDLAREVRPSGSSESPKPKRPVKPDLEALSQRLERPVSNRPTRRNIRPTKRNGAVIALIAPGYYGPTWRGSLLTG